MTTAPNKTTPPSSTWTSWSSVGGSRFDIGSFLAGLLFLALGIAFMLEADDRWTFELSDFRYIGPLILIVIGLTTLVGAGLSRADK